MTRRGGAGQHMHEYDTSKARQSDAVLRCLVAIIAAILIVAALYYARSVFAPLSFALFIIAIVWPFQKRLEARLPKLVALAISILTTIVVLVAFTSMVAWAFSRVGRWMINDAARLQTLYGQLSMWLEDHGIILAGIWSEHFSVGWLIRVFQEMTSRINNTLSFSLIVLIYVMLGLLEVDDAAAHLRQFRNQDASRLVLAACTETAVKFRKYMLVRTLMSVMTGLLVFAFAALSGLHLATEWGVIAFALNYIPFIGPAIATVFPTLFAIAQFESWQMATLIFICLNLIQFLVGSYLEPRIAGSALAISPFLVLFAVFFWAFLWGIPGTFIGVPIVIALLAFCAQYEASRWVASLLSGPLAAEPRNER
jgi:AI-2 transport protein TqsA